MRQIISSFSGFVLIFGFASACGMQEDAKNSSNDKTGVDTYMPVTLPGQNGRGLRSFLDNGLFRASCNENDKNSGACFSAVNESEKIKWFQGRVFHIDTIQEDIDLGQNNCIKDFENKFEDQRQRNYFTSWGLNFSDNARFIFFGVSQGTATLLNWLGQKKHDEQKKVAAGLVLESVLGSANNAIIYNAPIINYLPFARFWLPWAAKLFYPAYNPSGVQAIDSAKNISPDIPVIIMHNKTDWELPVNDAREVYCALRESGHQKAYLFEVDTNTCGTHLGILNDIKPEEKNKIITSIHKIYKDNSLPYRETTLTQEVKKTVDLTPYQPDPQDIRALIHKDAKFQTMVRSVIDIGSCVGLASYLAYRWYTKK